MDPRPQPNDRESARRCGVPPGIDVSVRSRFDALGDTALRADFADDGLGDLIPRDRVEAALRTIHRLNVCGFADGAMGAVNGVRPDGTIDLSSEQS